MLKPINPKSFNLQILVIRIILSIYTVALIVEAIVMVTTDSWNLKASNPAYKLFSDINSFVGYGLLIYILYLTWTTYPSDKNKRISNTLMVVLLNVIGMWLWLPTKKEREKFFSEQKDDGVDSNPS